MRSLAIRQESMQSMMRYSAHLFSMEGFVPRGAAEPTAPTRTPETEVLEEERAEEHVDKPWRVVLYNDEIHTFQEVTQQLIKALGCPSAQAEKLVWKVHSEGKATVYRGGFEECFEVQAVLREIQLVTEIKG